ncbi:hypothetical protein GmHk_19G054755 [Glycine max]|nr:hypothetical protein GmHk_19G054755 [Glycine max]
MKTPQNAQNSYQHNHPNFSIRARSSLPTQVEGPATTEKVPAQHAAPATPRPANNATPGTSYDNLRRPPRDQLSPIPMAYSEIWPSLLENHLVVAIPGKVFQPPYPKWYNSNATCAYHSGAPGHNIDSCLPFKYKVQHLINAGWLSFQEEGPNVKTNPLASHGGASVNAIEKDRPSGSKRLEDVATSRRFIYQSLQAACMVSRGGDKSDECLFHLGELHDMETCLALEVFEKGREDPQICTQSAERRAPPTPKALVICFTRNMTSLRSEYPPVVPKPMLFSYKSDKVVPWKYTPPSFGKGAATEVDSLSAKVTNITGLTLMVARVMLRHGYEPGMGFGKDSHGNADVVDIRGNPHKCGLRYELGKPGRRNAPSRLWVDRAWPGHVSQCFTSARIMFEEEVAAIGGEAPQDPPSFVRLCHPNFQLGNWHVTSQSEKMAPKKLSTKRSRRDAAAEGSSAAPEFDSHCFRSTEHQQRFEAIKGWSFHRERRVQLREDEYTDF